MISFGSLEFALRGGGDLAGGKIGEDGTGVEGQIRYEEVNTGGEEGRIGVEGC